jgi:hypothetical protein
MPEGPSARERAAIRALAIKALAEGRTQRAFFADARAAGIQRRESEVLRPIWTQVKEAQLAQQVETQYRALGYGAWAIRQLKNEALADARAKSIRLSRSKALTPRVKEARVVPERFVKGKGVVAQPYQYAGDIEIQEGSGRSRKGARGTPKGPSRRFYVTFGSDKPLTRDEVERAIRGEWKRLQGKYKKAYGPIMLGAVRITRADRIRKVRAKRKGTRRKEVR